jgi:hypothetical protein
MRISPLREGLESDNRFPPALAGFLCAAVAAWLPVSMRGAGIVSPQIARCHFELWNTGVAGDFEFQSDNVSFLSERQQKNREPKGRDPRPHPDSAVAVRGKGE